MHWTRLTLALVAAGLAGCASNAPSSVLAEGPRMIDLYRGTPATARTTGADQLQNDAAERRCRWWLFAWSCERPEPDTEAEALAVDEPSYERTAANELELLFPRLPNPDIYIHVLPHLATDQRVPVPGYTTAVPLYERVEYALPGELERAMLRLEAEPGAAPADVDRSTTGGVSEGGDAP